MKPIQTLILLTGLSVALAIRAAEQPQPADSPASEKPAAQNPPSQAAPAQPDQPSTTPIAPALPTEPPTPPANAVATAEAAQPAPAEMGTNGLRLNFRGAPLDLVLDKLSEAFGFTIVKEVQPRGTVDVWSNQPLSKEEAVDLLNSVLNRNGYAAIRNERTLTIVNKDEAKTKSVPVKTASKPEDIPKNDEIATYVIPVRFVEVAQLIKDLQPLVSTLTPLTANESGNSIVITDTQANIRRVAEVIHDIDMGAESFTEVRVFPLHNADAQETADMLGSLFPDDSRSGSQAPVQFGFGGFRRFFGGGGGPGGFGGNQGGNTGSSGGSDQRLKKRARVIAVADLRTGSVVVSAAKDLMDQIADVISELDGNHTGNTTVTVFSLNNCDPQEAQQVLQDIFQKNNTPNNRNNMLQSDAFTSRAQQNVQSTSTSTSSSRTGSGFGGSTGGRGMGSALP